MDFEIYLKNKIFPELEMGRPDWDVPHTEMVVQYVKDICNNEPALSIDRDVLVVAAYAHDWGYVGLFENGKPVDLDEVNDAKEAHMRIGAEKLNLLLKDKEFDFLSGEQKMRAVHLVGVHDKLSDLRDIDELVLMEADTLGGLDIESVKPSFNKSSNEKYMQSVRTKRYPLFITKHGKREFERLYKKREEYFLNK